MTRPLWKLADRASLGRALCCGALAFDVWVDGLLGAMGCQGDLQDRQLEMQCQLSGPEEFGVAIFGAKEY